MQFAEWLHHNGVGSEEIERPIVRSTSILGDDDVGTVLGGLSKLSETTRRNQEKRLSHYERREAARKARAKKVKKGSRHPRRKEATVKRRKNERWKNTPLKSLSYGHGHWAVSQEEWDLHIGKWWKVYSPLKLRIKRKWGMGTKAQPYTIYHLKLVHDTKGVLFDGADLELYELSTPTELDIKKAPEGAELFTPGVWLTRKKLRSMAEAYKLQRKLQSVSYTSRDVSVHDPVKL